MGRWNNNAEQHTSEANSSEQQQVQHFSHPHALHHTDQPQFPNNACSACKLTLSGPTYSCFPCSYFLHASCSKLPRNITHPSDRNGHTLHLLPVPPYPEGSYRCAACGKNGTGFCYNCAQCHTDIHTTCVALPLSVPHGSHHHQLDLTFSPPYHNTSFSCDVCRMTGSNHWLYRCHSCSFDVHLDCATGKNSQAAPISAQGPPPMGIVNNNQRNYPQPGVQYPQPIPMNPGVQYQQPIPMNPGVQYQQPIPMNPGVQYQQQIPMNPGVQYYQTGVPNHVMQYQQPIPQGSNYGPVRPYAGQYYQNGGILSNSVNGLANGASQAVGTAVMTGLLGSVLGVGALGISGAGGGGGDFGGGGGGYAGMCDLQSMQYSDSMDTMNGI